LGNTDIVVWSMFLGGIFLVVFDLIHREKENSVKEVAQISYKTAVLVGVFQSIAMVPGVSRAAATIIGGLILGVQRKTIVEFSFLLAVPTILAASVLDLIKQPQPFSSDQWMFLAVGFVTSFVIALFSIKFLLHFIKNHNFVPFGVYRIAAALIFWFCLT
jgi:undecaprenyl-diphosphatase